MRNGTFYAKRLKRVYQKLRREQGAPKVPEASDPIDQLVIGLLGFEAPISKATRARRALLDTMVDYNEVRVSTTAEIGEVIGPFIGNSLKWADRIRRALNAVFRKEHEISLKSLHKMGRREARHYLEQLDGVDAHAVASVILWSLGGHAIPVDLRLYDTLRERELVHPEASLQEVQAFLERNISAEDARVFCLLMRKWSQSKGPRAASPKDAAPSSQRRTRGSASERNRSTPKKSLGSRTPPTATRQRRTNR